MNKNVLNLVLVILLTGTVFGQYQPDYKNGLNTIKSEEIKSNITFLASDSLKGRAAGTEENLMAAMFIANKFKEYGLKEVISQKKFHVPVEEEDNGLPVPLRLEDQKQYSGYFQNLTVEGSKLSDNLSFHVTSKNGETETINNFQFGVDFIVQDKTASDKIIKAPVVFAGYGIPTGEKGYNDLLTEKGTEIDVKGKLVVIFDGFPGEKDTATSWSKSRSALYRNVLRKADALQEKGAVGIIVIPKPNEEPLVIKYENLMNSFKTNFYHLPEQIIKNIPIIFVNRQVSNALFAGTGKWSAEIFQKINTDYKPAAFELKGKTATIDIKFQNKLIKTQNVAGFIEGNDPKLKDEVIVIGAHYDHVGFGEFGAMNRADIGQIHNGADDNASGTVALIELAEALSKSHPKRSILFIGFTAEEMGLLGSKYYAYYNPIIPLNKTAAMLNLDMISRNSDKVLWVGGAFFSSDLKTIIEEANKEIGFELLYNVGLLNNASDQAPFLKLKIPAAFFFAGLHDDYHTPKDKVDKIDCDKIEKVTKLAYLTTSLIGNRETTPEFKELSIDDRAKLVKESLEKQKQLKLKN